MTSFTCHELLRSGIALSATSFTIGPATAHADALFAAFAATECDSFRDLGFGYGPDRKFPA